jgi:hypothetical protein
MSEQIEEAYRRFAEALLQETLPEKREREARENGEA